VASGPAADYVQAIAKGDAVIAEGWVVLEVFEFRRDDFSGEAETLELVGDEVLSLLLEPGESRVLNQSLKKEDQVFAEEFDLGGDRAD
jgi:hypothetical protein